MKICIVYFSGTGNTKRIIELWTKALENNSVEYDTFNVESTDPEKLNLSIYDKVAFAYPVHAFNAPLIMLEFAKSLKPVTNEIKAFFIMVSGEYLRLNNSSGNKLKRILRRRNIILESDYHYLMPYNIIFRHTEENAFKMYDTAKKIIPHHVKDYIVDGKTHRTEKIYPLVPVLFFLRIEQHFSKVNGRFYKVDMNKCIRCMKCADNCPVDNIHFTNGKFEFDRSCLLCTRCSFNCPKDAFTTGMMNGWRVNKPYKFEKTENDEINKHKNFCKRSYERYYREADEIIKSHTL